jgi:hypothetical protein
MTESEQGLNELKEGWASLVGAWRRGAVFSKSGPLRNFNGRLPGMDKTSSAPRQDEELASAPQRPNENPGTELSAEVVRLARLRDTGVLTDEEFRLAKGKLLGR